MADYAFGMPLMRMMWQINIVEVLSLVRVYKKLRYA